MDFVFFLWYFIFNFYFVNECEVIFGWSGMVLKMLVNGYIIDFVKFYGDV